MKKRYIPVIALLLFLFFGINASAAEPEDYISEFENAMPEDSPFSELDANGLYSAVSPGAIIKMITDELSGKRAELASFFLSLLAVVALSFCAESCGGKSASAVRAALSVVLSSIAIVRAIPILRSVCEALKECDGIFLSISAIFSSITLAAGGALSSAAGASAAAIISALCTAISSRLLPLVAATGFACGIFSSVGGSDRLSISASKLYSRLIGILTLLTGILLSTQGIVAACADSATLRAIKYGAQTAIPIVGGAVSSTLSILAGGLGYAKGIVGAGAVGALLYTFLAPLALLFAYRLAVGVALFASELIGIKDLGSLSLLSGLFDSLIASVALSGALYLLEIIIFISCGVSL